MDGKCRDSTGFRGNVSHIDPVTKLILNHLSSVLTHQQYSPAIVKCSNLVLTAKAHVRLNAEFFIHFSWCQPNHRYEGFVCERNLTDVQWPRELCRFFAHSVLPHAGVHQALSHQKQAVITHHQITYVKHVCNFPSQNCNQVSSQASSKKL